MLPVAGGNAWSAGPLTLFIRLVLISKLIFFVKLRYLTKYLFHIQYLLAFHLNKYLQSATQSLHVKME